MNIVNEMFSFFKLRVYHSLTCQVLLLVSNFRLFMLVFRSFSLEVDFMQQNLACFDQLFVRKLEIFVFCRHVKVRLYEIFQIIIKLIINFTINALFICFDFWWRPWSILLNRHVSFKNFSSLCLFEIRSFLSFCFFRILQRLCSLFIFKSCKSTFLTLFFLNWVFGFLCNFLDKLLDAKGFPSIIKERPIKNRHPGISVSFMLDSFITC